MAFLAILLWSGALIAVEFNLSDVIVGLLSLAGIVFTAVYARRANRRSKEAKAEVGRAVDERDEFRANTQAAIARLQRTVLEMREQDLRRAQERAAAAEQAAREQAARTAAAEQMVERLKQRVSDLEAQIEALGRHA